VGSLYNRLANFPARRHEDRSGPVARAPPIAGQTILRPLDRRASALVYDAADDSDSSRTR